MIHPASTDRFRRSYLALAVLGGLGLLPGCPVDSNADVGETSGMTVSTTMSTTTMSTTAGTEADSSSSGGAETEVGPVDFMTDILPIMTGSCAVDANGGSCHEPGGTWGPPIVPDFDLTAANAYMSLLEGDPTESILPYVTPNEPDMSYLVYKIRGTQVDAPGGGSGVQMPQQPPGETFVPLPEEDIARIEAWIEQGAPE